MLLKSKIPSIYHSILPQLLSISIEEEKIATCENCTICRSVQSPYINTKCCTYHPYLVNFLIGAILFDKNEYLISGKEQIYNIISRRVGITPYGFIPSLT